MTTKSIVVVAKYLQARLEGNVELGLEDVFYGDQALVPRFPAVAVEGESKETTPTDLGQAGTVLMNVLVIVYHSKIGDNQTTREQCDTFAEGIEDFIHTDRQLGGLVTHSWVAGIDYGYARRNNELLRAARIRVQAISKTRIGQ